MAVEWSLVISCGPSVAGLVMGQRLLVNYSSGSSILCDPLTLTHTHTHSQTGDGLVVFIDSGLLIKVEQTLCTCETLLL